MGRVVYSKDEFIVIEDKRGHVVINTKGNYGNHGHIKRYETAKMFIRLMDKKQIPRSDYLRKTVLRVSLDERYKDDVRRKIEKDRDKQRYFNPSKGVIGK